MSGGELRLADTEPARLRHPVHAGARPLPLKGRQSWAIRSHCRRGASMTTSSTARCRERLPQNAADDLAPVHTAESSQSEYMTRKHNGVRSQWFMSAPVPPGAVMTFRHVAAAVSFAMPVGNRPWKA